jgi:acetyl-CoA C-acetyltransferase
MKYNEVFIAEAVRSPLGSFQGSLSSVSASEMASQLIRAALIRISLSSEYVSECILGSVLTAGQGQAPARQAAIAAGLPYGVPASTVNKVCSSGLYAVHLAARSVHLGLSDVVIAGGMESMSRVPYYLSQHRTGARLGNTEVIDGIIHDGLWDVYNNFHMGMAGEMCAEKFGFSREDQDAFALESYERANNAITQGLFKNEIVPISVKDKKGTLEVNEDEEPGKLIKEKVSKVSPVFKKDGTITAVNASSLNDGAAVVVLCSEAALKKYNLVPKARVLAEGVHAREPEWFTLAPVGALQNALDKAQIPVSELAAVEINEAFSSVGLACTHELGLSPSIVNVRGGAVALGHPIGASGVRILVTLLSILKDTKGKYGAVAICNGGGEATAMVVENI